MPSFEKSENPGRALAKNNEDFRKEVQQDDRALVKKRVEKMAPERIFESRCHVCCHPFRDWIELMLVRGMQYQTLADRATPPVSRKSIASHHKTHMDLQDAAFRALIDQEAQLQGLTQAEGIADILTSRAMLEVAIRQAYNDITSGVTTVEARDMTQMIKLLGEMNAKQQEFGLDEVRAQMQIFIQAIREECDQETQNRIGEAVARLRKREKIDGEYERLIEGPVVEAHVVEEYVTV